MLRRLDRVQALRFCAALSVVIGHTLHELRQAGRGADLALSWIPWEAGVDIFFVISGFIMVVTSYGAKGIRISPSEFILRRLARVVPMYWAFTALMILSAIAFSSAVSHNDINLLGILNSILFIPSLNSAGIIHPVLGLGWTLNYEMFFYAIFAACMIFPGRSGLLFAAVGMVLFSIIGIFINRDVIPIYFWSRPIILEFVAGMIIGILYSRGVRCSPVVAFIVAAASVALFCWVGFRGLVNDEVRWFLLGLPAVLIVCSAVFNSVQSNEKFWGIIAILGDASYALYLSHPFTINALIVIEGKIGFDPSLFELTVIVLLSVIVSLVIYFAAEKPVNRHLNAIIRRRLGHGTEKLVH